MQIYTKNSQMKNIYMTTGVKTDKIRGLHFSYWSVCLMMVVAGSNIFSRSQGKFSVENSGLNVSDFTIQL